MSIVYQERIGSRSLSSDTKSGSLTGTRTFLIYDDDGDPLDLVDAMEYENGVFFDDVHPDIDGIFAVSYTVTASSESANVWVLTWTYSAPETTDGGGGDGGDGDDGGGGNTDPHTDPPDGGGGDGGGGGGDGGEPPDGGGTDTDPDGGGTGSEGMGGGEGEGEDGEFLYTGVSITTGISLVDGYVAGATIPANGAETGEAIASGTVVHEGGEPVTIPVPTTEVSLSIVRFGETFSLGGVQSEAAKRNSGSWYEFSSGSVLFRGMNVQRTSRWRFDVTFSFSWDAWSHMRQVPKRDEDGKVDYEDDGSLEIYFKQPFPTTTGFWFSP
jgi:hypothetical protein